MKKIKQYNSTQESILDAANRVLAAKGAEGFTLDRVAAEAAVSAAITPATIEMEVLRMFMMFFFPFVVALDAGLNPALRPLS